MLNPARFLLWSLKLKTQYCKGPFSTAGFVSGYLSSTGFLSGGHWVLHPSSLVNLYAEPPPRENQNSQGDQNPNQGWVCRLNIHKGILTPFSYYSGTPYGFLKFEQVILIYRGEPDINVQGKQCLRKINGGVTIRLPRSTRL